MNATTPCSGGVAWTNYPATETVTPYRTCTPSNLGDIVAIVQEAEAANKHVHAFGSAWSYSDCAITTDYLIDTRLLNRPVQTVQNALLPGQSPLLYHIEAGMTIENIYTQLEIHGLALETMGGSSGQTIAGAISTGTHGGDLFMPPLADSVLAIHLVGPGGAEYWIEPSPGITDPGLLQKFVIGIDPHNVIYDTATFNACLVSLGCMGVIYAVVLRVREAYDLIETTAQTTWQAFLQTVRAQLGDQTNRFLQVAVSPYPDSTGNNPCLVTTRSEAPATVPATRPQGDVIQALGQMIAAMSVTDLGGVLPVLENMISNATLTKEQIFVGIVQTVLSQAPDERPVMTEHYGSIMAALWPPGIMFRGLSYSVMDTSYGQPAQTSQPSYSAEVFFPSIDGNGQMPFAAFVSAVIEAISAASDTFYTGYVSLRFTGPTRAALGMQQWPQTCAVEFSSLQGVQGELALYPEILGLAARHGALVHWGQINQPFSGNSTAHQGYANWRTAYATMSKNFTARTFENALSTRWSLTTPLASGQLWHNEQADSLVAASWTNWNYLSNQGNLAKVVKLAAHPDGRMHAVMAGLDNQVWHNEQTAAGVSAPWTDWHVLSQVGNNATLLALAAHPDGRMHAVMAGQ